MKRQLLDIFVNWFDKCNSVSQFYRLKFGVRQGSVLAPYLFAVYLDDIVLIICIPLHSRYVICKLS